MRRECELIDSSRAHEMQVDLQLERSSDVFNPLHSSESDVVLSSLGDTVVLQTLLDLLLEDVAFCNLHKIRHGSISPRCRYRRCRGVCGNIIVT